MLMGTNRRFSGANSAFKMGGVVENQPRENPGSHHILGVENERMRCGRGKDVQKK